MIEINLLPKDYLKKSFNLSLGKSGVYAVAGGVGVLVMLLVITFYQVRQVSRLDENMNRARQRAAMLQNDIRIVDALIDVKAKINDRMAAVEKLDGHRSAWVRILEDIAQNVPEFIWLGRFAEQIPPPPVPEKAGATPKATSQAKGATASADTSSVPTVRRVTFEGYAFTLNALAKFMINLMRSDYFDEVELVSTEEKKLDEKRAYNFVMTSNLHFLSDEDLRKLIAQAAVSPDSSETSHEELN
jgi:Tfp pilus assembly protein PilN